MRIVLALMSVGLLSSGAEAQSMSRRQGLRWDLGAGVGRFGSGQSPCVFECSTLGPSIVVRAGQGIGRTFEVGGETRVTAANGSGVIGSVMATMAAVSPAEYAGWIRVGIGLLVGVGFGHDDVTLSGGGGLNTMWTTLGTAAGASVAVGLDIPLGHGFGVGPEVSYTFAPSATAFHILHLGLSLRLP